MKQRSLYNKCAGERREMKNNVEHCIVAAIQQCNSQCVDTEALMHANIPQ